jgi:hypothetical protein
MISVMTTPDGWSDAVVGEVRRLWGEQLRPVDQGRLYPLLSARTREFLATVGLPVYESNMGVALLHDQVDRPVSRNGMEYIPVAGVAGDLVDAIEVETDRVCFIGSLDSRDMPRFVNTDVGLFLVFLGVCEKDIIDASGSVEDADEAYGITDRARELLTSMDPEAMRQGGSWDSQLNDFETDTDTAFPRRTDASASAF